MEDTDSSKAEDQIDTTRVWDPLGNLNTEDNNEVDQDVISENIRSAYAEFCTEHGKVFDESRLPIYAENLSLAEKHFENTGERLKLNEVRHGLLLGDDSLTLISRLTLVHVLS